MPCKPKKCFIFPSSTFTLFCSLLYTTQFILKWVKMRRFPSVRRGRGQKGTRLLLYSFCLFVIKDPTLLHSRRELSYLTLSPAKWPPKSTCLEWSLALSQQQTQEWHQSQLLPSVLPELARQSLGSQTSQKHLNSTPGFATTCPWESYLTIEASGD